MPRGRAPRRIQIPSNLPNGNGYPMANGQIIGGIPHSSIYARHSKSYDKNKEDVLYFGPING